jgi:hypothetical protein
MSGCECKPARAQPSIDVEKWQAGRPFLDAVSPAAGKTNFNWRKQMSTKTTVQEKKIKPLLNFGKLLDPGLLTRLQAIHDGMNGNTAFPAPPVDMATFQTAISSFSTLTTNALDGGKKAISAKKKQREAVIKMATQLGHYVWAQSNNELAIFNTSGFQVAQNTKIPVQPLPQAAIQYVDRGPNSGQIVVKPKTLRGAVSYEMRYAVVPAATSAPAASGAAPAAAGSGTATPAPAGTPLAPGPWTSVMLPGPKATTVSNLTPATTYQFQVRGLGKLGYSDWSDPANFICG